MSGLHPLVSGFAADVYDRGRPAYGSAVTDVLAQELSLSPGARVLDLGAGTGKLSRALLDAGFDVVAVEPLADMRALLAEAIGAERALEGTAEAIPLANQSVDAVTMADSFHWFDERPAIEEIRRVLRPGGGVSVMFTAPGWHGMDLAWVAQLNEKMAALSADHPIHNGGFRGAEAAFADAGGFAPVRQRSVEVERETGPDAVLAYVASISWVGSLPPDRRSRVLDDVEALLERHSVTRLHTKVHTMLFLTELLWPPRARPSGRPAAAS